MTYWTVVPDEADRSKRPSKVIKQLSKPGTQTKRVAGYAWVHGFKSKKLAIEHLNRLGVPNSQRPTGYKTYDV
jgi:hypothetical protein